MCTTQSISQYWTCCGQLWVRHMICGQTCDGLYHFTFCSEIDHIHLSSEAQCVSHLLPQVDCHRTVLTTSLISSTFLYLWHIFWHLRFLQPSDIYETTSDISDFSDISAPSETPNTPSNISNFYIHLQYLWNTFGHLWQIIMPCINDCAELPAENRFRLDWK